MAKGQDFQWEIAKLLSFIWTNFQRDDIFQPTRGSGSQFTKRQKTGQDTAFQAGDLTFSDSIGKPIIDAWSIECKTGYPNNRKNKKKIKSTLDKSRIEITEKQRITNWDALDLIDGRKKENTIETFWNQCFNDATLSKREPILIFRRIQKEPCIAITEDYKMTLEIFNYKLNLISSIIINKPNICIYNIYNFFDLIGNLPKMIKEIHNEKKT